MPTGKGFALVSDTATTEIQDTQPTDFSVVSAPAISQWAEAVLNEYTEPSPAAPPEAQAEEPPSLSFRKHRDFWLVWSGQSVSMLGDGLYGIAMAWWITQQLGSATALAGYALCWFIPAVTLPFIAGSLIDRANRKR